MDKTKLFTLGFAIALLFSVTDAEGKKRRGCPGGTVAKNCSKSTDTNRCMTCNAYAEARGEGLEGMIRANRVVLTRAKSGRYPRSACGVIYQKGQFSWKKGTMCVSKKSWAAAEKSVRIARQSGPNGKLYYHADYVRPKWSRYCSGKESYGNHIFYSDCYTKTQWASIQRKSRSRYASAETTGTVQ